jgi:Na+-transporting NADH:ubiquinone oxidoreductase subunit B
MVRMPQAMTTSGAPHVRDVMNLTRAMNIVLIALVPCVLVGIYNTGYQASVRMAGAGMEAAPDWHDLVISALGTGYSPAGFVAPLVHGLLFFLPVLGTALIAGGFWETVFVRARNGGRTGDFVLVALLFSLSMPPSVPLWQVALGMSFGIVVGKEIFGGTGKNFLNPALTGLAFLYVTYPAQMVGETAWAVYGLTGATPMETSVNGGLETIEWAGSPWMQSFLGLVPGPIGATSTLACLIGAAVLIATRVASPRIMAGSLIGMIAAALLSNTYGDPANPYAGLTWHWHLVLGSFAFATVFLATDPVSAPMTNTGRWIYGLLVGALVILIRVANSTHPDGVMFAILFGNILAPLIDHGVMQANIRRRMRRSAR